MTRTFASAAVRAALITTAALALAACNADSTAPAPTRNFKTVEAHHDDLPPDTPCRSGWVMVDGKWVCEDTGA